jgi:hypothetical protein
MNTTKRRCRFAAAAAAVCVVFACTTNAATVTATSLGPGHAELPAHLDFATDVTVQELSPRGRGRLLAGKNWGHESSSTQDRHSDAFKHLHDGRVLQPFDDHLLLSFVSFNKTFNLELRVMDWLFDSSGVNITDAHGQPVAQRDPLLLTSYHARMDSGADSGWASVTMHESGSFHAVIYLERVGEVIQVDPVAHALKHEHEDAHRTLRSVESHTVVARRLSMLTTHQHEHHSHSDDR